MMMADMLEMIEQTIEAMSSMISSFFYFLTSPFHFIPPDYHTIATLGSYQPEIWQQGALSCCRLPWGRLYTVLFEIIGKESTGSCWNIPPNLSSILSFYCKSIKYKKLSKTIGSSLLSLQKGISVIFLAREVNIV